MKKILTLSVLLAVALCLPLVAGSGSGSGSGSGEEKPMMDEKMVDKAGKAMRAKGTITAWNEETHTFKVEDKSGRSWTFKWNDETTVHGTPKIGEMVKVEFTKDTSGTSWATQVHMVKEEMAKPAAQ